MEILGIDVGGTGIKSAIVDTATGELLSERQRIATPYPATPEALASALNGVLRHHRWQGRVGMGFPAAIPHGVARTAANIDRAFLGLPMDTYFLEKTGCRFFTVNDADAAGMAEMRFGVGKGHTGVVLVVTIGTWLGTALFSGGQLLPNTELGHVFLENARESELYASETVRVTQALGWEEWGERLNLFLVTMERLLWPDLIVLGGGVSDQLHEFSPMLKTQAPVVAARFLNQAGIVGAALHAEESLRREARKEGDERGRYPQGPSRLAFPTSTSQ